MASYPALDWDSSNLTADGWTKDTLAFANALITPRVYICCDSLAPRARDRLVAAVRTQESPIDAATLAAHPGWPQAFRHVLSPPPGHAVFAIAAIRLREDVAIVGLQASGGEAPTAIAHFARLCRRDGRTDVVELD